MLPVLTDPPYTVRHVDYVGLYEPPEPDIAATVYRLKCLAVSLAIQRTIDAIYKDAKIPNARQIYIGSTILHGNDEEYSD